MFQKGRGAALYALLSARVGHLLGRARLELVCQLSRLDALR